MRNTWLETTTSLAGATALVLFCVPAAMANPEGGQVVAGSATISQSGNKLDVNQQSDRTVIDWRKFDIAPNEHTQFHQPSSAAVALNRVKSENPSQVMGKLTANGNIVLINPNGVFFGRDSKVDVNGIVATTADINNVDFMAGKLDFNKPGNPDAKIVNEGSITAKQAGLVGLVAPNVLNNGVIKAKLGKVHLASGDTVTVDLYGNQLLNIAVSDKVKQQLIRHSGAIDAQGGTILLTAAAGKQIVDSLIDVKGELKAPSIAQQGGKIIIGAGNGKADISGKLDATGLQPGEKGGHIEITGKEVTVRSGAVVDASGHAGGGEILVGGDYQGKGTTPRADKTVIEKDATLKANATVKGDGGKVIVWADGETEFHGKIEAKGGFVETSGKKILTSTGSVDAGTGGQWLLDPTNVTISGGGSEDLTAGGPNTTGSINASTIQAALNNGTSVTVTTDIGGGDAGDITLASVSITKNSGSGATLALLANQDILTTGTNTITTSSGNNTIYMAAGRNILLSSTALSSGSGALSVILNADADGLHDGAIRLTSSSITSNGGEVILSGGDTRAAAAVLADLSFLRNTGRAWGVSGEIEGVELNNTDILTTTGNVTLRGHGWDNAATSYIYGIYLANGGDSIISTGTGGSAGNITLDGIGGNGDQRNHGIYTTISSAITSRDGDISMTALGNGSGAVGMGMDLNGVITSNGTGADAANITITTTGATNNAGTNTGLRINTAATIQTIDGDISITGTGKASGGVGSTNYGVWFDSGKALSTGDGNITLNGTGGSGQGTNYGVILQGTALVTAVKGAINITGLGAGSANNNSGIYVQGGADVTSTGTGIDAGTITMSGTGGNGGNNNRGVYITGLGTTVTSARGAVSITGTGGTGSGTDNNGVQIEGQALVTAVDGSIGITGTGRSNGTASGNVGIYLNGGRVTSTGTGSNAANITMTGNGATGTGANSGFITNWNSGINGTVTTVDGDVSLTGIGQSSGGSSIGFYGQSLTITSTGTGAGAGTISINGTAGTTNSNGIYAFGMGISSVDGNVALTGQGSGSGNGINFITAAGGGNAITSTGSANITLTGSAVGAVAGLNLWNNGTGVNTNTIGGGMDTGSITFVSDRLSLTSFTAQNSGSLTFKPYTEPTTIGVSGGSGTLQITDALLANFTGFNRLIIGDSLSGGGAVDVDTLDFSVAPFTNMRGFEVYGGSLDIDTITGATNMDMYFGATGLNASTGVVDLDSIGLINNDGVNRSFYIRSAASALMSGSALFSSSGALRTVINADSDGNSAGAIRLTATAFTTLGGEVILSGGNSGQTALSAADLTYLRDTGYAWGVTGEVEGIELNNSDITTTTGNVTLRGHGWNNATASNYGVYLQLDSDITSLGTGSTAGNITLNGIGGNGTNTNKGIIISDTGTSLSSVDGDISLTGTGGTGASGVNNIGIHLSTDADILTSGDANITFDATKGNSGATFQTSGATISIGGASATGNITFLANDMTLGTMAVQNSGTLTFKPKTTSTTIAVSNSTGTLRLLDADLAMFSGFSKLVIGDSALGSGVVTVDSWDLSASNFSNMRNLEIYGGEIVVQGTTGITNASNLGVILAASGLGGSTGDVSMNATASNFTNSDGVARNFYVRSAASSTLNNLTLNATNGDLNVYVNADSDGNSNGYISLLNTNITTRGGDVIMSGGNSGQTALSAADLTYLTNTGYAWSNGSTVKGILFNNSDITVTDGDVTLRGQGWDNLNGTANNHGVYLTGDSDIASLGTGAPAGNITLIGVGGDGTNSNKGVFFGTTAVSVTSYDGDITITGTGGAGNGSGNSGLDLTGLIQSYGTGASAGNITLTGTSGTGTSPFAINGSTLSVLSADGDITLTGIQTTTYGSTIQAISNSTIASTGDGNILVDSRNTAGVASGFSMYTGTNVLGNSAGTGNLTFITDKFDLTNGQVTVYTGGNMIVKPYQSSTTISVGAVTSTLTLDDNELAMLNIAGKLIVGDSVAGSGALTVTTAALNTANFAGMDGLELYGGSIAASTITGGTNIDFTAVGSGLGASTGVVSIDGLSLTNNDTATRNFYVGSTSNTILSNSTLNATNGKLNAYVNADSDGNSAGAIRLTSSNITTNGGEVIFSGGDNRATATVLGDLSYLRNTGYAWGVTGEVEGIELNNSDITTAGSGNITLRGHGWNNASANNYGVYLQNDADLTSGGTGANAGNITINGVGGNGTSDNSGVYMVNATTSINTVDGDITLTGTGGTGTANNNMGINLTGGTITASGTGVNAGTLRFNGTAGLGAANLDGISVANTTINAVDGVMEFYGTGGNGTAGGNIGVLFSTGAFINSTGLGNTAANITIDGTGGNDTAAGSYGVWLTGTADVTTKDGDVTVIGRGSGTGGGDHGISLAYGNTTNGIRSLGTGANAGNISLTGTTTAATSNGIWFRQMTVSSVDGDITINGTGFGSYGVYMTPGGGTSTTAATGDGNITITGATNIVTDSINSTGWILGSATSTGDITLIGDRIGLLGVTAQNSGTLTFKALNEPTTIGISGGAGTMNLDDTELGFFSGFSKLVIGDSVDGSGAVDIDSWTLTGANYSNMASLELYGGSFDIDGITATNKNILVSASGLNASTGVVDIDALSLTNNDATTRDFYIASTASTILSNSTLNATNGGIRTIINADRDANQSGAIRLTSTTLTNRAGEVILSGADNRAGATVLGDLATLRTTGRAWGVTGEVEGIELNNSDITTTTGNITLRGHGYDSANTTADNYGVYLHGGSDFASTGTGVTAGTITLNGIGGDGTNTNHGVYTGTTDDITSVDGDISITGTSNGNGINGAGVNIGATVISSGTGANAADITINGTGSATGGNDDMGIVLSSTGVVRTTDGDINIVGLGRNGAAATGGNGIQLAGLIDSIGTGSGAGMITLNGTGSTTGVNTLYGVYFLGGDITSIDGDIGITGISGKSNSRGIYLFTGGTITSSGTSADAAMITLNGTSTGGSNSCGVALNDTAYITSGYGAIDITGSGGTSGSQNRGIIISAGADISSTGTLAAALPGATPATITLRGTTGGVSNNDVGIYLLNAGTSITSVDGDVSLTGTGGPSAVGTGNHGIHLGTDADILLTGAADLTLDATKGAGTSSNGIFTSGATVSIGSASATGDFTFISDDMSFANAAIQNSGTLTIKAKTEPTTIGLSGGTGDLNLTDSELNMFSGFSKLVIGDSVDGGGLVDIVSWSFGGANYSNMRSLEIYGGEIAANTINNATNMNMLFSASGLNGSTGAVSLTSLTLANNDGVDRNFYIRSVGNLLLGGTSTLSATSGKLNTIFNSDSDGNHAGAVRLVSTNITTNGGEFIASGGNSGQAWLSAADLTYLRNTGRAWGMGTETEGVEINDSDITTAAGNITLRGHGLNDPADNGLSGVYIQTTSDLLSTTGNITLDGIGGNGTSGNRGTYIRGKITSGEGDIDITGVGGNGSSSANIGVYIYAGGQVTSTGTGANAGTITIDGTGGNGTSDNHGVYMQFASALATGITAVDGAIDITGQGGNGSADSNIGIYFTGGPSLTSTGTGAHAASITLNGTGGNGTYSNHGISLNGASTLLSSAKGTIDINGTSGVGTGNNNHGVTFSNNALVTAAQGSIDITGIGRNAGTGTGNYGVVVASGADITSTASGPTAATITLHGTGGNGTTGNRGVNVEGVGTTITSIDGDISLTGIGGNGTGSNSGTYLDDNALIASTGIGSDAANITLHGTGGAGSSTNTGLHVITSTVSTVDGDILGIGLASTTATGSNNRGVTLSAGGTVRSTGTGANAGTITLQGTGGSGANSNMGILLSPDGSLVASVDGNVSLTGIGGTGTASSNHGISMALGADISLTGDANLLLDGTKGANTSNAIITSGATVTIGGGSATGDFTFAGDDMNLADLSVQTTGGVTLKAKTAGTAINVGSGTATTGLSLTDTELGYINAGSLTIGDSATSGDVHINTAHSFGEKLTVISGLTNDLYLDAVLVSTATGDAIVLVAGDDFINAAGASALDTDNGRWLVYSTNPLDNTRNGLLPDASDFGKTYAANAPATIGTGNRFVYSTSTRPTLTLKVDDDNVTYGDNYDLTGASYTYVSGLMTGDTLGTIGITGAASYGTAYTAGNSVGSSPYTITATDGTLAAALGYQFNWQSGALTVDKRALTATVNGPAALTYGDLTAALTKTGNVTWGNIYSGDTGASLDNVTFTYGGATVGAVNNAGSYALGISGFSDDNYTLNLGSAVTNGTLTIGKRALTAVVNSPAAQTYGDLAPTLTKTGDVAWGNLVSGESGADLDSVTFSYGGATAGAVNNAGNYALGIGAFSDNNYTLNLGSAVTNGTLTVDKRALTAIVNSPAALTEGAATPTLTHNDVSWTNLISGDSSADLDSLAFTYGGATAGAVNVAGNYSLGIGGFSDNNYTLNLASAVTNGTLTINTAPSGGGGGGGGGGGTPPTPTPPTPTPPEPTPPVDPVTPQPPSPVPPDNGNPSNPANPGQPEVPPSVPDSSLPDTFLQQSQNPVLSGMDIGSSDFFGGDTGSDSGGESVSGADESVTGLSNDDFSDSDTTSEKPKSQSKKTPKKPIKALRGLVEIHPALARILGFTNLRLF